MQNDGLANFLMRGHRTDKYDIDHKSKGNLNIGYI